MSLDPESDILSPLPQTLHRGLTAVAALAFLSFSSCALAFIYLTYKLIRWHIKSFRKEANESEPQTVDLALGLAERHFGGQDGNTAGCKRRRRHPNQFLVLIYNLLLADMHQATAFMLNSVWVSNNSIIVGTPTCFVQGLMVSNGDLASSCFITAIAVHTYLTCVRGYKPPQWALYVTIIGLWIFVYGITFVGLAVTDFGKPFGGYYVRAAAWCWVNIKYENLRLLTHYLFIFISLVLTGALYTAVFLSLRQRKRSESPRDRITSLPTSQNPKTSTDTRAVRPGAGAIENHAEADAHSGGSHPAFLVYPVIYIVCTAPLALGRVATMAGADVPLGYFCAAGALITSNGWLDVLLWGFTRRALLFNADVDTEESGLETFTFMRTPHGRKYGNMVWVEGAGRRREADEETPVAKDGWGLGWVRERMGWRRLGLGAIGGASGHRRTGTRSISQETLRGAAAPGEMSIQMDMVTTVVVEIDADKQGSTAQKKVPSRAPSRAPSRTPSRTPSTYSVSMHSSEKDNALRY